MIASLVPSLIRTYVPLAVGYVLTLLAAKAHLGLSPHSTDDLTALAVALVSAGYYLLVRLLEQKVPQLGWLLGHPGKPTYDIEGHVVSVLDEMIVDYTPGYVGVGTAPTLPPAAPAAAP